jgi:hypothetical protein
MINRARHITCILLLLIVAAGIARAKEPKIAKRLYLDSTIFTMKLEPGAKPAAGKTFKVRIHVTPKQPFHVWSANMSDEGGLAPLKVTMPDTIADYFELTAFKELGKPETAYDSNFQQVTKMFSKPFDLIATIKVKKNAPSPVPFYLWVTYGACDGKTKCIPPTKFNVPMDVIGDQPIMLKIAENILQSKGRANLLALSNQAK